MPTADEVLVRMGVDNAEYIRKMRESETAAHRVDEQIKILHSTLGKTPQVSGITGAMDKIARSSREMGTQVKNDLNSLQFNTSNIVAQFNDIGVTAAGGMSPLLISLQQGTQLSQAFAGQKLGSVVKGIGGAFLSLLSPMNLVTLGLVGISAALIQFALDAFGASEEAKTLKDIMEEAAAATDKYREATEAVDAPLSKKIEKYGLMAFAMEKALRVQQDLAKAEATSKVNELADKVATSLGKLESVSLVGARGNVTQYLEAFAALDVQFGLTQEQASKVYASLVQLSEADGPQEVLYAAMELQRVLESVYGSYEKMPGPIQQMYNELNNVVAAAAEANGVSDNLLQTVISIKNALQSVDGSRLVAAFQAAFPAASQLLGIANGIMNTLGRARADAAQMQFDKGNMQYSGRGGDPRQFMGEGPQKFNPDEEIVKAADALLSPKSNGGGGGGGGGGGEKKESVEDFIRKIREMTAASTEAARADAEAKRLGTAAAEALKLETKLLNDAKQKGIDVDQVVAGTGKTVAESIREIATAAGEAAAEIENLNARTEFLESVASDIASGLAGAIKDAINGTKSFGEAASQVFSNVIAKIGEMIIEMTIYNALAKVFGIAPKGGGILAALGLGFDKGGFTGFGSKNEPAGIVHKGEYVFDQDAVRRIGLGNLREMHKGTASAAKTVSAGVSAARSGVGMRSGPISVSPAPVEVYPVVGDDAMSRMVSRPGVKKVIIDIVEREGFSRG